MQFIIERSGKRLLTFPAQFKEDLFSLVLGQPQEISYIIGRLLSPVDLAQAMRVCKAWYREFGRESLWIPHLRCPLQRRPAKVEVAYQTIAKECWIHREVVQDPPKLLGENRYSFTISPDGSSMLAVGDRGKILLWSGINSMNLVSQKLNGDSEDELHKFEDVLGAMFSPDGTLAYTFGGGGFLVQWRELSKDPKGKLIAGFGMGMNPHSSESIVGGVMSRDGKWGLTHGWRGFIVKWDGLDSSPRPTVIAGPLNFNPFEYQNVHNAALAPDGSWGLTVGLRIVVYWKGFLSDNIVGTILKPNCHETAPFVSGCAISPDGSFALTGGAGGRVVKWTGFECENPTPTLIAGEEIPDNNAHKAVGQIAIVDETCALLSCSRCFFWSNLQDKPQCTGTPEVDRFLGTMFLSNDLSYLIIEADAMLMTLKPKVNVYVTNGSEQKFEEK